MVVFISLALLGVGLRWFELGRQSLWFDEGYSAYVAGLSPARIVRVIQNDVSPPLYYLLLHGWTQLFGQSELALRSMSSLAGTVAMGIFIALALRLIESWPARIMAMALFALSPLAVQFSQEARSYSLGAMLVLGAIWGMLGFLERGRRGSFVLVLLCTGLSVWLHNMMWFYLAALNAAWLLAPSQLSARRRLLSLALLDAIIVAAYLPWVPSLLGQMQWLKGNFWATVPTWSNLTDVLGLIAGSNLYHVSAFCHVLHVPWLSGVATLTSMWLSAGLLAAAACSLGCSRKSGDQTPTNQPRWHVLRRLAAVIAIALLPVLAVFVHAQSGQSYFIVKIFAASALVLPLAIGIAMDRFPTRRLGIAIGCVLLAISCVSTWGYFRWEVKEDWRGASRYVNTLEPKGDPKGALVENKGTLLIFIANEGEYLYNYYCERDGMPRMPATGLPQGFFDLEPPRTIQRIKSAADMDRLAQRLATGQFSRVVLVLSHTPWSDPAGLAKAYMDEHMVAGKTTQFDLIEVREYFLK